ncbi:type II secretion system protein [Hydrogenophaga sp. BPS33]|uniref:type II secretion system protein n=1 Tax=Hydrogenophaga sp. BPS33 TaxID=2651974 RepID=UPI00131FF20B|nr:prepilin-type N-terminal cleavage/methylation domain-containing protein [Hydrogenophaga sp. BPS33]QHE86655.1 prepilin-type N-terminal cleavage/methylation domain-containing protein [Hydrogenophaga sp. BPS33]
MHRGRSRAAHRHGHDHGFTLIELLVVLAVLAVLAGIVTPLYLDRVDDARETVLRQNLVGMRQAIDQFYRDKGRYPKSLPELVEQRYLRAIPQDPVTQRADTWVVLPPSLGASNAVYDVKSGATGRSKDGTDFQQW